MPNRLTDNGASYVARHTRAFALDIGLQTLITPPCSPQSKGMAESFVKTMKRDYIAFMPQPDARTPITKLGLAFAHYNERHPHSALKHRSPRGFRPLRSSPKRTLTWCAEIWVAVPAQRRGDCPFDEIQIPYRRFH